MKQGNNVWLRWNKKNSYSIAALMVLVDIELTAVPRLGIMLYSFATAQAEEVYREVAAAKSGSVYIAGGPHPSALPEEALQYFDYVVVGEAEETLPELIDAIKKGRSVDYVLGIAYHKDGRTICTPERPAVDLDLYLPSAAASWHPLRSAGGAPGAAPTARRRGSSVAGCGIDP